MSRPFTQNYALYKGEDIIACGTAKEIAQKMNVRTETVYYWHSPTYKKRNPNGKALVIIK